MCNEEGEDEGASEEGEQERKTPLLDCSSYRIPKNKYKV